MKKLLSKFNNYNQRMMKQSFMTPDDEFVIVTELALSDLEKYILDSRLRQGDLSLDVIVKMLKQMIDAVMFLNSKGIIHRDLNPKNFLIFKNLTIKLSDFGLTTYNDYSTNDAGTGPYKAPEVGNSGYDKSIDVWSLGVIIMFMCTGNPKYFNPMTNKEECLSYYKLVNQQSDIKLPEKYKALEGILNNILKIESSDRISFEKILQNELFQNIDSTIDQEQNIVSVDEDDNYEFLQNQDDISQQRQIVQSQNQLITKSQTNFAINSSNNPSLADQNYLDRPSIQSDATNYYERFSTKNDINSQNQILIEEEVKQNVSELQEVMKVESEVIIDKMANNHPIKRENKLDNGLYSGAFENGMRHGQGIMQYTNGYSYSGGWVNDKRQGFSRMFYPSGKICIHGAFFEDMLHGTVCEYYENGKVKYKGNYKNNQKSDCNALLYDTDGTQYQGPISKGKRVGKYKITKPDQTVIETEFKNDQQVIQGCSIF
ncbi:protein kinase domain containing protein [Stylonychia lemnae]|uniref:Protein kinase domain containing protein n=1 Tax=Stylonychia lemnae TaxID=5949 RepID=A0A078APH1_STYLE|nr:protein kinase domain containing protein [Stylonychia lemnae]|eukprot:CDW83851.1 protein kinase domain containing protein [Stylonychia lemnae]